MNNNICFHNLYGKFIKSLLIIFLIFSNTQNSHSAPGWLLQYSGTNYNLISVYFVNALTGYTVGDSSVILKTTNGGINWVQQTHPYSKRLLKVHFINSNTGWAVGGQQYYNPWCFDYEYVIKTSNGGANWLTVIYTDMGSICYDVSVIDANSAFVSFSGTDMFCMGSTGALSKTINGGANWEIYVGGACRTFHFLNANTGWSVNMYLTDVISYCKRRFYMTTNAGVNWQIVKTDSGGPYSNYYYGSIRFLNGTTGYFNDGFLKKTTNSGYNWTNCDSTFNINSLHFVNSTTGWVTGGNKQIRITTNGGLNWTLQQSQNTNHLYSIYMVDALTGYAVGGNGTIVKTVTGGVTSAEKVGSEIPSEYELEQNYPNPFNSMTNVKFKIPNVGQSSQTVTIKVFDISGKEVATLVNEKLNSGTYEVRFDVRHGGSSTELPSGIYFYRMETKKFTDTKKLVLLK